MLSFKDHIAEGIHAPGTQVAFPHKGVMTTGKIVRYEKGGPKLAPHYVIDHGQDRSATAPPHKVEKYTVFGERVSFIPMNPTEWDAHLKRRDAETQRNIAGKKIEKMTVRARVPKQMHAIHEEASEKFVPATKTAHHYQGQINGKTYVVPHSVLNIYRKEGYAEPMRHSIVTSQHHVQHNNPDLTPEEVARVHGHIQAIHGGQEKVKEEYEYPDPSPGKQPIIKKIEGPATRRELKAARPMRTGAAERFMRRYGKIKLEEKTMNEGVGVFHGVATYHQTKIAKQTLRMPDAMVGVMGGPDKEESRKHLKKMGWSDKQIHKHEHGLNEGHTMPDGSYKAGTKVTVDGKHGEISHVHHSDGHPKYPHSYKITDTAAKDPYKQTRLRGNTFISHNDIKPLHERTLTAPEETKKEEIVMSMKKKLQSFKDRYGDKAKSVMYATATKHAKALAEEVHAYDVHHAGKHIDTVFYNSHQDPADVKKSLVHHDGYHPNITVKKQRKSPVSMRASKLHDLDEAARSFMATYNRNENANRHTANIVHLAKHFGDKADQEKAQYYADELKKHGSNIHHEAQYEIHKKLWPKAAAAHGLKEETEQLNELSKETLKSYIGRSAKDLAGHAYMAGFRYSTIQHRPLGPIEKRSEKYNIRGEKNRLKGIKIATGKLEEAAGQSFAQAIKSAKELGHKITYGTASKKWHTIDKKDRDYHTGFALLPGTAERHGEAASRRMSSSPRQLEETSETLKTVRKVLDEAFTRQHFRQIAAVIKAHTDPKVRQTLANHHADMFAKDNPRFSHEKFHTAAGTEHTKKK